MTDAGEVLSDEDCRKDRQLFGLPDGPCQLTAEELAQVAAHPVRAFPHDS